MIHLSKEVWTSIRPQFTDAERAEIQRTLTGVTIPAGWNVDDDALSDSTAAKLWLAARQSRRSSL